ncbi:hypothetical protein Tsubulata_036474 [Turnera subulata]|uniref:GDSL esterase/lipase n=1 Tax=Turnera subulata TaxID=218843 RepID=A0A9Q0JAS9_9ROSI|nr:hypothetical protein Tsubulata_036474 [Turnera subulata]
MALHFSCILAFLAVALVATHAALLPVNSVLPNTTMPKAVTDGLHLGGGVKLFVFGDSFADTGNFQAIKRPGNPFNYPLGMTWPGKPTGRQSDGYVLTDIIALFFNMTSALPTYSLWEKKSVAESELKNGMNFAFGLRREWCSHNVGKCDPISSIGSI